MYIHSGRPRCSARGMLRKSLSFAVITFPCRLIRQLCELSGLLHIEATAAQVSPSTNTGDNAVELQTLRDPVAVAPSRTTDLATAIDDLPRGSLSELEISPPASKHCFCTCTE